MKHSTSAIAALALLAGGALIGSCSRGENRDSSTADVDINNFEIREILKTASQSYRLVYQTGDTAYLTISATVQWPLKLGDHTLAALQDSLIAVLQTPTPYNIDQAMSAYVSNPDMLEMSDDVHYSAHAVDSVPPTTEAVMAYDISTTARVQELTESSVTYQVYYYAFTGGAHPNYCSSPFTYDLLNSQVMTFDNTFRKGSDEKLLDVVEEALANQLGVTGASGLSRAGIFMDQMHLTHNIYVLDGQIVFHYNPYDIGPYALGAIDVSVAPFVVQDMLTPQARELLLD